MAVRTKETALRDLGEDGLGTSATDHSGDRVALLCSISVVELHDIAEFAGRQLRPGTLYGAIARLESWGYIEPLEGDERRRPYRLTARGAKALRISIEAQSRVSAAARRRLAVR